KNLLDRHIGTAKEAPGNQCHWNCYGSNIVFHDAWEQKNYANKHDWGPLRPGKITAQELPRKVQQSCKYQGRIKHVESRARYLVGNNIVQRIGELTGRTKAEIMV